jgi:threonyl-tRNA synthetase
MGEEFQSDQDFALGPEDFPSLRDYRLHCLRHSTSHIMAAAVQQLFPDAMFGVGPPIKDRFYYDMGLPRPLTPEDLEEIERRMRDIINAGYDFHQETWSKEKAIEFFGSRNQPYKTELIEGIPSETVSTYQMGDFTDLCAGPHVGKTSECEYFKLLSIAGAHWRGNENNPMLQRVYGTVWPTEEELQEYLQNIEEAKRRDHRKLGRELELFMTHKWAPRSIIWLPKGTIIYHTLQNKMRQLLIRNGYVEVKVPILANAELFKTSGHWDHYKENMFIFKVKDEEFALKPMNCPGHMLIFGAKRRSYRELPLRLAEQTILNRNEPSGALGGMTRVRQFQQDDSHIFVTEDQIGEEVIRLLNLVDRIYKALSMPYRFMLSTRNEENYMGDVALWDKAESALREALEANSLQYSINKGDAAFYGPKIDLMVQDSLKNEHQCATIQLDFQLPRKFKLIYVTEDNSEAIPVVIHRAIYGSLERFIGVLIEHYGGAFPVWLAPVQAKVMSISEKAEDYAIKVYNRLMAEDIRVELDTRNEKINAKIRDAQMEKVPYMLVVGQKEANSRSIAVRSREKGDEGATLLEDFIVRIKSEADFSY